MCYLAAAMAVETPEAVAPEVAARAAEVQETEEALAVSWEAREGIVG